MNSDSGYLVEDFLEAVSAQLDRHQDALAAKAKVRPMTFALRDFAIDLLVFVDMDVDGNIRLRSAAPGETGASTLKLDFTTITRPMIEENTMSLAMTQAPSLKEVGLRPAEQRQLERIGVRNVAQLNALRASGAGVDGIARLTEGSVPADRLREALRLGRPQLFHVTPAPPIAVDAPKPAAEAPAADRPVLRIAPGTQRLQFVGRNLLGDGSTPAVRLGGQPLETAEAGDDRVVVKLPSNLRSGALEIDLGDDEPVRYDVHVDDGGGNGAPAQVEWIPEEER